MDNISTYLLTQGVLGVACIVLGFVISKLYNKTDRLEKEKAELMEARRVDSVETTREVIGVLRDNAQNVAILSEKIEVAKSTKRRT